jgi:FkbM family methyltransferase
MTSIRTVRGTLPGLLGDREIRVLEGDTHIGRWVEEAGRLDHDQSALPIIGKLIGPESVVYDIGAFIGDHTAFYASLALKVVAFEASLDAARCLAENVAPYRNVVVFAGPVGDGSCVSDGVCEDVNKGARHVVKVREAPFARRSLTIDRLVNAGALPPPNLIKLDIEGWEVRALRGAEGTLLKYHPTLVVEVNRGALERACTSPEELHDLLTRHGYEMHDLFTGYSWEQGDLRPQFDVVATVKQ